MNNLFLSNRALFVAGCNVRFVSEERNRPLVEDVFGLNFEAIAGDSIGIIFEKKYSEMLAKGKMMEMIKETGRRKALVQEQVFKDYERVLEGAQLIISGGLCMTEVCRNTVSLDIHFSLKTILEMIRI